jgi:hypothetical protein
LNFLRGLKFYVGSDVEVIGNLWGRVKGWKRDTEKQNEVAK